MQLEVDEEACIACGLCEERAPENLARDEDRDVARVIKQPSGEDETECCTNAVDYCPTGGLTAVLPRAHEDAA
jgi:ferredoxin